MALILEILPPARHAEVRERRLLLGPLTIGRALDNDLVLDDPHVDAHHARLEHQPEGGWLLVDLGSVNGIGVAHGGRSDRVIVGDGAVVTLGRTTLRVRDAASAVPPALPLHGAAREEAEALATTGRRVFTFVGALMVSALFTYLDSSQRAVGQMLFGDIIALTMLLFVWSGIWSLAARAVRGRFDFLRHLAIASTLVACFLVQAPALNLVRFFWPAFSGVDFVGDVLIFAILAIGVPMHLAAASHLARAGRRTAGLIAGGLVVILIWTSRGVEDDGFTARAEFKGQIRTFSPALVPKQSPEEFKATRADLKAEIDRLMAESAR